MGLLTKPNELTMKETYAGLIYGQPGVGKSTLALSSVNPVCIDIDRGMYRVEKRYQVPSLQVESYQQVLDLLNSNELDGFDTIVIDTLGKLIDRIGDYVAKNNAKYRQGNGQLTQQGWGQLKIEFHALIKLINGKDKSVIFVAHESEEKEGDVTKKRPDVSGSARKDIVKELDFMGYMEISGNKRTISFSPSSAYYAKNSMGLDEIIEVPGIQTANNFIRDVIISAIQNRKEQDQAQAGPYDELIKKIDDLVNAAKDAATLNEVCGKLTAMEHIWDSKLYAWSKINEAAKRLGGKWDKATKQFVSPAAPLSPAPAGGPSPTSSGNENAALPPPKNIEQQCREAVAEISNILNSATEAGERIFTDDEVTTVEGKLAAFSKNPLETQLALINYLLDEHKVLLQQRLEGLAVDSKESAEEQTPSNSAASPTAPGPIGPGQENAPPEPANIPSMYQEQEAEEENSGAAEDDGFVDDIPEDGPQKKPGKNTSRSLSAGIRHDMKNRETATAETAVASKELDIF